MAEFQGLNGFLSLRLALRALRSRLSGFRIFILCLALGVGAIATVQTTAHGLNEALKRDGNTILGGDILLQQIYNPLPDNVYAVLHDYGASLSEAVEMRIMARTADGSDSTLVELKAVDSAYPLYGALETQPPGLQPQSGEALIDPSLQGRLNLEIGDMVVIGDAPLRVAGILLHEPDRAGNTRFGLAPRVMMHQTDMEQTGLVRFGSMAYYALRVRVAQPESLIAELEERFAERGWDLRTADNASPQVSRFIGRLTLFLTLTGLTALLVGGIGITNAVRAHMDRHLKDIATLKCLGASGGLVFRIYLLQVTLLGAIGIAIGLLVGLGAPPLIMAALHDVLPVRPDLAITPLGLILPALFGFLTLFSFAVWPIGQAHDTKPADLFRATVTENRKAPRRIYKILTLLAASLLAALIIATSSDRLFALWFVIGAACAMLVFVLAAWLVILTVRRIKVTGKPLLRLALTNMHRPGNATAQIVLSLGLGLSVLVAVAQIEGNLSRAVAENLPDDAPAFFFLDIQPDQREDFTQTVLAIESTQNPLFSANIRGRIERINDRSAADALVREDKGWLLQNDRGLTWAAEIPGHSRVLEGAWWDADYDGPPLLSIVEDVAQAFNIGVGDSITVNILGRDITAKIANVRSVNWGTLTINFALTFAPGALEQVPHTFLATVQADPAREADIQRAVTQAFPNITVIRLSEAITAFNRIMTQIGLAIRIMALVALVTGVLVLSGAVLATYAGRVREAVILKTLGAKRRDILTAWGLEYGICALATAGIAVLIGTSAAWGVLGGLMDLPFAFLPQSAALIIAGALSVMPVIGFSGTYKALREKAADHLRNE